MRACRSMYAVPFAKKSLNRKVHCYNTDAFTLNPGKQFVDANAIDPFQPGIEIAKSKRNSSLFQDRTRVVNVANASASNRISLSIYV